MDLPAASGPLDRTRSELSRPDLVWVLTGGLALGGLLLTAVLLRTGTDHPSRGLPWWVLAALFYLVEVRVVHLQFQREAHSFTLSEIPLVVGIFLASPGDLVLAAALGAGLGLLVHRRPAFVKLAFNIALFIAGSATAAGVFRLLTPTFSPLDPMAWLAAFAATLASTGLSLAAVNAAIRLAQGRTDRRRIGAAIRFGVAVAVTNTCLALAALSLLAMAPQELWLLSIPLALVVITLRAYRAQMSEAQQHDSLELLYGATRILHDSSELEGAIVALLTEARRTFRAGFAELILFTAEGHEQGLRTILGPEDEVEVLTSVRLDHAHDALRIQAVAEGVAFLAPVLGRDASRTDRIRDVRIRDAMVAPLVGERSLSGTFVVANRQGALGSFRLDELRLFETLANHAGIALENGRLGRSLKDLSELKDQLRHQALHDSLTGLGNRALFLDRLAAAVARRGHSGPVPVVLFIDLDDFKSVNDSLGHAAGDALLKSVAAAIGRAIRPNDLAVRLAGDEFAVLVEDGRDIGAVIRIGERILQAVARPVDVGGTWITTSASIGIAASRSRVQTAEQLLKDADLAMYAAKGRGKGRFTVFDPSLETELTERQQLRDDLATAVARGQLTLRYQPVTDLKTGEVVSLEALLRWDHPTRGELTPADFLAVAEESGLIVPIGRWVLREACRQARSWSAGSERAPSVSVNISLRQLIGAEFADDVAGVLRATGLPPEGLVLEFAEAQVMSDEPLIATRLRELKELGVVLAIDGFGNGFSSVRNLGRFPVDVIKIARPLVATMSRTPEDARIAGAIVAMGHSLRLQVVAEGIETSAQLDRVRTIACDRAQGFFLARPMEAAGVKRLLERVPSLAAG